MLVAFVLVAGLLRAWVSSGSGVSSVASSSELSFSESCWLALAAGSVFAAGVSVGAAAGFFLSLLLMSYCFLVQQLGPLLILDSMALLNGL